MIDGLEAVLFDYDGVLADTMEDNYRAWSKALGLYGIEITKQEYFVHEGRKVSEIVQIMFGEKQPHADIIAEVTRAKDRFYAKDNNLKLFPGVSELLDQLKKRRYKIGMVSGASSARLRHPIVDGLRTALDVVICGDDCQHGKPAPEPYLRAAERLAVMPSRCVVIENAPMGIKAAKAAGMSCIAVCSTLSREFLTDADRIVERVTDIGAILVSVHGKV